MNKPKTLRAIACVLFAAAFASAGVLAALPAAAYATTTVEVTDSMASDGVITLSGDDKAYVVNKDLNYPIEISGACSLTFNNGATLTVPSDSDRDAIHANGAGNSSSALTITNAKVVQPNSGGKALRMDKSYVKLVDCDFESSGPVCIDEAGYELTIESGTYKATTENATSVIYRDVANIQINGGTFVSRSGVKVLDYNHYNPYCKAVAVGGLFSNPDIAYAFGSDKVLAKDSATGYWKIVDNDDAASADAKYSVSLNTGRVVAYFATQEEAEAFSELINNSSVSQIEYDVTFDADGGSPAPSKQHVVKGEKATQPSTPYKQGYEFTGWYEDGSSTPFDFDTPITGDVSLKASYKVNTTQFTVTFNAGDGVFPDGSKKLSVTYVYGQGLANPTSTDPTLDGKYFDGWETKDGQSYSVGQAVTSNLELYVKWVDPAAQCDGVNYKTLQDAINAARAAATGKSVVTLLRDVEVDYAESSTYMHYAVVITVDGLTVDLNGHSITYIGDADDYDEGEFMGAAVAVGGCKDVVIKNGKIYAKDLLGVLAMRCQNLQLIDLDVETSATNPQSLSPIATCPVDASYSSITFSGGSYVSKGSSFGAYLDSCATTILSGTFTGPSSEGVYGDDEMGAAIVADEDSDSDPDASLQIQGGEFTDFVVAYVDAVTLTGGSFGTYQNATDVAAGYAMLKRAGENGRYEVVSVGDDGIPADACSKVTATEVEDEEGKATTFDVYFEDNAEAEVFQKALSGDTAYQSAVLTRLRYKVSFSSQGEVVSTKLVTVGQAVGELYKPEEPAGQKFCGWYVDDAEVDETYTPADDVTLTAKWVLTEPVATCDGVGYATLQEALAAAKDGSTVTLLKSVTLENTSASSGVTCKGVKNLTLDLGMHEITYSADAEDQKDALYFANCENLAVKNGYIEATGADAIYLDDCQGFEFSTLDAEAKGGYGSAVIAFDSSGKFLSGSYEGVANDSALYLSGGSVEILGGAFTGGEDEDKEPTSSIYLCATPATALTVSDGTFFGAIEGYLDEVAITGGTFDSYANASEVNEGYAMLKRAGESGLYEVVAADDEGIPADAFWSITISAKGEEGEPGEVAAVFYFEDGDDAKACYDECVKKAEEAGKTDVVFALQQLRFTVSFMSELKPAGERVIRAGKAVGELPAGKQISGWTFQGWYLGDEKVDAAFVPEKDVTLVALWMDESGNASDNPTEKGGDKGDDDDDDKGDDSGDKGEDDKGDESGEGGKSDEGDGSGKSDKSGDAIPQTGDATNALLPACVAVEGAIVCALGLVFRAHKRR